MVDWVACDKCDHWHKLPEGVTPGELPDPFTCREADWQGAEDGCGSESDEGVTAAFELIYETLKLVRDRRADLQTNSDDSQTTLVTDKMDIIFLHTPVASKRFFKEVPNRTKFKSPDDGDDGD